MSQHTTPSRQSIDMSEYLSKKTPERRLSGLGRELYALEGHVGEKVDPVFAYNLQKGYSMSFDEYRRELERLLANARRYLATTRSVGSLAECERLLAEARAIASAMLSVAEIEKKRKKEEASKKGRGSVRTVAQTREEDAQTREAKKVLSDEISPLALEVNRAIKDAEKREGLMVGSASSSVRSSAVGRESTVNPVEVQQLIDTQDDLMRNSLQVRDQTELIGNEVLGSMQGQRNQLYNASGNIEGTRAVVDQSRGVLRRMEIIEKKKKFCLWLLIAILILANILMFWSIASG